MILAFLIQTLQMSTNPKCQHRLTQADIISDKICSKTNKNNQGQVTNLSEQVIAMGPGNEFTPKFKMDAHEDTKINIYEDEDMNIHNNTAAV